LTAFFSIFKTPVLYAFGASDATIVYARDYISIYLIGTIFVQLALGLNAYISGQGEAKIAMLSVLIGAVLNICLDPLFILYCIWVCAERLLQRSCHRRSVQYGWYISWFRKKA
ncbi:MAG: MATE family efflux transporter, partial [Dorea sp.]